MTTTKIVPVLSGPLSPQPDERTDKVDETEIGPIQLVEAREDAAKLLEFVDATFDQMAFAVEPGSVRALDLDGLMRWNDRLAVAVSHGGNKGDSGIAAIRDDLLEREPIQEHFGLGAVVALPSGQQRTQRIA
jgi:hypothetical protein